MIELARGQHKIVGDTVNVGNCTWTPSGLMAMKLQSKVSKSVPIKELVVGDDRVEGGTVVSVEMTYVCSLADIVSS